MLNATMVDKLAIAMTMSPYLFAATYLTNTI